MSSGSPQLNSSRLLPHHQIDFYYSLYDEVTKIALSQVFDRWLILNLSEFRSDLLYQVNDWIQVLKDHLKDLAMERLDDLERFIVRGRDILNIPINKEDYEGLLKAMEIQAAIKEKRAKFNDLFQPLLNIVELLRIYGEEFSQDIYSKVSNSDLKRMLHFFTTLCNC